jgi:Zn-dependent protease with chaperone function
VFITEVALTHLTLGAMKRASTSRSIADLLQFGCVAPVYVVPDRRMAVIALAVGLTPASSAVFVQQHIEDALQCNDPIMLGRAERILAHEAGHIVQRHGLWRTIAVAVVATILPLVVGANDLRSLAILGASLLVFGAATFALGEWAAERFAERATSALAAHQATPETIQ